MLERLCHATQTLTVLTFEPPGSAASASPMAQALKAYGITLLERLTTLACQRAIHAGCRVGLLLLTHEEDMRCLGEREPLLGQEKISWVGLVDEALLLQASARRFIGQHLFSFLAAPADPQHVALALRQAWGMASVRAAHYTLPPHESMIGKSAGMQRMFDQIGRVARTDAPVLINGASGTGKEMVAQSIHRMSHRRDAPFVAINCGAIATHLFQSELFGHEKGAFTGAHQRRIGRIELAKGGTLFLDEIGDMPFDMQVNLLRFLQEKTIERVGGTATLAIDVRIIAATNVDLADAVRRGSFREDLYYRINVVCLQTPPLAERGEDIAELAHHFLVRFATAPNAGPRGFSAAAMDAMMRHPWPGNVRELMNRVQRAVVMAEGRLIQPADLDLACHTTVAPPIMSLEATRSAAEREIVLRALALASNRISHAANLLGVARLTLYRLIEKHGISLAGRPVPKIKPRRVEKEEA